MSSRKRDVILVPEAREDEAHLLMHSVQAWGEHQATTYEAALHRAFDELAEFPELGRARPDLFPGCRMLRVQQHYILYRFDDDAISVVRIVHVKRDIASLFTK